MDDHDEKAGSISIKGEVGPGSAVGHHASVSAGNIAGRDIIQGTVSKEELTRLIEKILVEFEEVKDQFSEEVAEDLEEDLTSAKKIAERPQPDRERLVSRLQSAAKILTATGVTISAVNRLLPSIKEAVEMAKALFGG